MSLNYYVGDHKQQQHHQPEPVPVEDIEDGGPTSDPNTPWPTSSLQYRTSGSVTPTSRQSSPCRVDVDANPTASFLGVQKRSGKRRDKAWYSKKRVKGILGVVGLLILYFVTNWVMLSRLQDLRLHSKSWFSGNSSSASPSRPASLAVNIKEKLKKYGKGKKPPKGNYERMLALAAHALAEGHKKPEPKDLWQEPFVPASSWKPCADLRIWEPNEGKNGYLMVTANGGMNQQRVAVCNAVVVARLLNATLVVPKFLYSSIWRDVSQFSNIYQEEHFINYLAPDIRVVKQLPSELLSLNLDAIGSLVTDVDIPKEAKPSFYLKHIIPILLKNGVVHLLGFGNRLAFDPIPFQLQRLRCRCNFHALRFVPKIQQTGALLLQRLRHTESLSGPLDQYLVGPYAEPTEKHEESGAKKASKYLALHLRFEIDMVAHSLCEFGGGDDERKELEAFREIHFPALVHLQKTTKLPTPLELRSEGLCPLTPEEAVLMLVALGFKRKTHIFVAGSQIYGGRSRMVALNSLYPKLVTKENLLTPTELEPFQNFKSQLAALDFIGCTASDAFAMTDSGSQLSSLVSGFRIYYGGGKMPTIRPNKRRLSSIFSRNSSIEWRVFEQRVRKAVRQTKHIQPRPRARSVYRYPRCDECMCNMTLLT